MPLSKKALNRRIAIFVVVTAALLLPVTASGGLIVHYNFEEAAGSDAIDLAGGDRPGTLINGATQVAGGAPVNGGAQALDVSGSSNAAVDLGSGGLLQDVGGSTFAAWVKPDTFQNGERFIYRSGFNGGRSMLMAGIDGADQPNGLPPGTGIGFQRRVFDESGGKATLGTSALSTGVWQHVALSLNYQTGDWAWYIDGADAGSGVVGAWQSDPSNSTADDNGSNTLGDSSPGGNGGFSGLIDDFRLYDHALSQAEVQALVPEPSSIILMGLGLWIMAMCRRRQ